MPVSAVHLACWEFSAGAGKQEDSDPGKASSKDTRTHQTLLFKRLEILKEVFQLEAWYVQQALAGAWPEEPDLSAIWLVCRPNLEVYRGWAGYYRKRYGNLRRAGVEAVFSRAVADGSCSADAIWLTQEQILPLQELAARFGHPDSLRIHSGPGSIRYWWLECARRAGPASA